MLASNFYKLKTKKFSFQYCAAPSSSAFGFSVSRSYGSAVLRNKLKRRMRHVLSEGSFGSLSLLCIIKPLVNVNSFSDICIDFNSFKQDVKKTFNA